MHVLFDTTPQAIIARAVLGVVVAGAVALAAYRLRSLTSSGLVPRFSLERLASHVAVYSSRAAILLFFISGTVLSKTRTAAAESARRSAAKQGQRDAAQVLANGGIAVACAVVGAIIAALGWQHAMRWMVAAVCALAAASGDTWSTEVGSLFGGSTRLITTMRPVSAGTSGGVSFAGTVAAPVGGALVGLAGLVAANRTVLVAWLALTALAGLTGSAIDSLLGATVQGVWRCPGCGATIEVSRHQTCDAQAILVRGWSWLDNDAVNLFATLCGAALGYALAT